MTMGPQDIKLAPDGSVFYIADSQEGGVWVLDGAATKVLRVIPTGRGAHGLYLSRDAKRLFVTNRLEGTVSVLDAYSGAVETTWRIGDHASPDMHSSLAVMPPSTFSTSSVTPESAAIASTTSRLW